MYLSYTIMKDMRYYKNKRFSINKMSGHPLKLYFMSMFLNQETILEIS